MPTIDAGQPPAADLERGERAQVVERADAARRRSRRASVASSTAREPVEVGPVERAVARDLGDDRARPTPASANRASHVEQVAARALAPSRARATSPPRCVEPDRDRLACGRERRTSAGSSSAAVPMTTRATPASSSAAAASRRARRRRSAPARRRRAAIAAIDRRGSTGSPLRAASRSTTWIHGAPGVGERPAPAPPGRRRRRSRGRSRPGTGARTGRRAGRSPGRGPSASPCRGAQRRRSCASSRRPAAPDFSGWNCVAHTLPRSTAATTGAAVVARGDDVGRVGSAAYECTKYTHVGSSAGPSSSGASAARRRACSTASAGASRRRAAARTAPGSTPRPGDAGALVRAVEQHLHADADAEERPAARRPRRCADVRRARALAAPPCSGRTRRRPGSTTPAASRDQRRGRR